MSRWSNSDSCNAPFASSALIAGARSAVIQVQACRGDLFGDACLGDHAATADQHHMLKLEAPLQLIDLGRQRHRIGGVALKDFNGDGTAVRSTEQAVDDL